MKITLLVVALCLATHAHAQQRSFSSFKLVKQRPAIHKSRDLHERIQPLREQVAACGRPIEGKPSLFPIMKLFVAVDGSTTDVVIENNKNLADETVECIRKLMGAIRYPEKKRQSVLTWVLVYDH